MNEYDQIELFILKCASIKYVVDEHAPTPLALKSLEEEDAAIRSAVAQFSSDVRINALLMAEHYKLFYMLENDIRRLIDDTFSEEHGNPDWWERFAPSTAKEELKARAVSERSDSDAACY